MSQNKSLSTQEVAQILHVSKSTIYELIRRGEISSYKIGRKVRFTQDDVDAYIARSRHEQSVQPVRRVELKSALLNPVQEEKGRLIISGQDVVLDISGSVVAIGNYNGRDIYVLNEKEQLCKISTTMPIRNLAVSENGTTTVIIYDTSVTYINTYDSAGNLIFSGQAHMSGSGYPAAVALSPNGKMLEVSYIYVDAGTVKTTVAFYNFGSVGDNYKDYLVCGYDYTDTIVPEVGFLSNTTSYAVADSRLMIYSGDEQPSVKSEYMYDREIRSVFSGSGHVGVVTLSDKKENKYRLDVYNAAGELDGSFYFDTDYSEIFFEKDDFVIYNDSECRILSYDGKSKFEGNFSTSVNVMVPTDRAYRYLITDDTAMRIIQLD